MERFVTECGRPPTETQKWSLSFRGDMRTSRRVMRGRVQGYSPRPDRAPELIRNIDLILKKGAVSVGGERVELPTSSV